MTQVPEETPDSLVPEPYDDEIRDETFDADETSRDLPLAGHEGDPASFLNPQ